MTEHNDDLWHKQMEGMLHDHHARLREVDHFLNAAPDASDLRYIHHIIRQLPEPDRIKAAVKHAEESERRMDAIINGFLSHAGKLIWLVAGVALLAWLNSRYGVGLK